MCVCGVHVCWGQWIGETQGDKIPRDEEWSGPGGGRTLVTYFAEEGVFFKTSACPRFCKRRVLFCTKVRSRGVKIN